MAIGKAHNLSLVMQQRYTKPDTDLVRIAARIVGRLL